MTKKEILVKVLTRARRNTILVETYLKKAGVPVSDSITLQDINALMVVNPDLFSELMDKLFPDASQVFGTASATGSFDWKGLLGGLFSGVGDFFSASSDTLGNASSYEAELAQQEAKAAVALAEQKAASTRNTMIIVLVILAVVVVAGVFIFKKRF